MKVGHAAPWEEGGGCDTNTALLLYVLRGPVGNGLVWNDRVHSVFA
jgi:hypothetical protein